LGVPKRAGLSEREDAGRGRILKKKYIFINNDSYQFTGRT
jgi:hypothetical protein